MCKLTLRVCIAGSEREQAGKEKTKEMRRWKTGRRRQVKFEMNEGKMKEMLRPNGAGAR